MYQVESNSILLVLHFSRGEGEEGPAKLTEKCSLWENQWYLSVKQISELCQQCCWVEKMTTEN